MRGRGGFHPSKLITPSTPGQKDSRSSQGFLCACPHLLEHRTMHVELRQRSQAVTPTIQKSSSGVPGGWMIWTEKDQEPMTDQSREIGHQSSVLGLPRTQPTGITEEP